MSTPYNPYYRWLFAVSSSIWFGYMVNVMSIIYLPNFKLIHKNILDIEQHSYFLVRVLQKRTGRFWSWFVVMDFLPLLGLPFRSHVNYEDCRHLGFPVKRFPEWKSYDINVRNHVTRNPRWRSEVKSQTQNGGNPPNPHDDQKSKPYYSVIFMSKVISRLE